MSRLLLILLVAIALLPAPQSGKEAKATSGTLLIRAKPLLLNASDPAQRRTGRLEYLAGWELTSDRPSFGGLSAMTVRPDDHIVALSDGGDLFGFRLPGGQRGMREFIAPLPRRTHEDDWPKWKWDSEALIHDPESGRYWVTFELINRICRYSPAFARVETCEEPAAMQDWPVTGGAEAAVRLPDGRFLIFAESAYGPRGSTQALLFDHDPAEPGTAPASLGYYPPQGYRITDAVWLAPGKLLTLNRRATIYEGFTAKLAIVDIGDLQPGKLLHAQEIATLRPPLLADNFEALAVTREGNRQIVWIASDDNHKFFQRTLLLKFALPGAE
jgi:hypothetical protein